MKMKSKKGKPSKTGVLETEVTMQLERDTPGAVRYQEVDDNGNLRVKDEDGAFIGVLYFRKAASFPSGKWPKAITVIARAA